MGVACGGSSTTTTGAVAGTSIRLRDMLVVKIQTIGERISGGRCSCWRARLGKPETVCRGMVIYY
jgi:hypothetical protein